MRDAAARAMHVWNSPRIVDDEVDRNCLSLLSLCGLIPRELVCKKKKKRGSYGPKSWGSLLAACVCYQTSLIFLKHVIAETQLWRSCFSVYS